MLCQAGVSSLVCDSPTFQRPSAADSPPGYYNEARLLDPQTLDTAVVLSNMPGSVRTFTAGRTYPLEGTTVMLPQYPPYTDPVTLLICGGSDTGDFYGQALDNCISIQPETQNPQWVIERMVRLRLA